MQPELSVIIPMYRESGRIAETLRDALPWLRRAGRTSEVVLVDDGSDDGTADAVLRLVTDQRSGSLLRVRLVRHDKNRGKGAAVRTGLAAATGRWRLIMDADNSARVQEVEKLLARARQSGAGLVCGSRRVEGATVEYGGGRGWMSGAFQQAVRALGYRFVRDTQCGFKVYRADAAEAIAAVSKEDRFAFDLEHLLLADRLGFRIAEVGIVWTHAAGGTVKPVRDGVKMLAAAVAIRGRVAGLAKRGELARAAEAGEVPGKPEVRVVAGAGQRLAGEAREAEAGGRR